MSPTKPTVAVSSVGSQRDNRYLDTFTDQHRFSPKYPDGRPWHGYREIAATKGHKDGFVNSDLIPGRHVEPGEDPALAWATIWHAPWMPEAKYFEFNYARSKIAIRYDRMAGDDRAAQDTYYEAAAILAFEKGEEVEYGSFPKFSIRAKIGDPPRSPKIAQAAQAGDLWLLGFSSEVNEELAVLLGLSPRGLTVARTATTPLVTPEAVVSASQSGDLAAMIAAAVEAALKAEREKNRAKIAKARAARGTHGKSPTSATPGAA